MAGRRRTIEGALACACTSPSEYRFVDANSVGKPVVRCLDCGETTVAQLGAFEADPEVARRKRARQLAEHGGGA
jgi:Zn ribbon nucleic-acid-binding protein